MADHNVGSIVVRDAENYLGIFTERNYSRNVILKNRHSSDTKVKDVMSVDLPNLQMLDKLEHCMQSVSYTHLDVYKRQGVTRCYGSLNG